MLLERNQALIGTIVAVVIAIGTVFAVGATGGLLVPGDSYQAQFTDAAGLESGSFVYIAGVRVGQVTGVELQDDLVLVDFSSTGPPIPADSRAEIILQNSLGKRAIQIYNGTSDADLAVGDTIPLDRTDTPIDLPDLGNESAELLTELDVEALQEVTTALADVADYNQADLERLLVGLDDLSQIIVERRDDLETLLVEGDTLLGAVEEVDGDIIRIVDAFGSTLDRLDERRGDVARLLNETVDVTDTANDLLIDREDQLDRLLDDLHTDLEIVDAHQVDLAHTFAYLPAGLEGFASIGYGGGDAKIDTPTWGNVFASELGPIGVETLLGCGGAIDEVLTGLIGPDPRCDGEAAGAEAAAQDVIAPAIEPVPTRRASAGWFFDLGADR